MVRSAGTGAQVMAHDDGFTSLKLPSGEIRRVHLIVLQQLEKLVTNHMKT